MYEVTFSIDKANENLLQYLYGKLSVPVNQLGGVVNYVSGSKRSKFALACNNLYCKTLQRYYVDMLGDVLSLGFKNVYLRGKLNLKHDNFFINMLINTMCIFDNKLDKQLVCKVIDVSNEVCIDGYYNFKMKEVKNKWNGLVKLVKNNESILNDKALIKEFLWCMVDILPSSNKTVSVVKSSNDFKLFEENNKYLEPLSFVYPCSCEEQIMLNLICIKPRQVYLYCNTNNLSKDFLDLINHLFDVKIVENS